MHTFEKIRRRATRGEITFHFFSCASRGTEWPLHFNFASYAYAVNNSAPTWVVALRTSHVLAPPTGNKEFYILPLHLFTLELQTL